MAKDSASEKDREKLKRYISECCKKTSRIGVLERILALAKEEPKQIVKGDGRRISFHEFLEEKQSNGEFRDSYLKGLYSKQSNQEYRKFFDGELEAWIFYLAKIAPSKEIIPPGKEEFLKGLESISSYLPASISKTFGEYIQARATILFDSILNEQFSFDFIDQGAFRDFLAYVFEKYPGDTIWATSRAHPWYFWPESNSTELAIREFVNNRNKGKQHRIFFLDGKPGRKDLPTTEELEILVRHYNIYGFDPNKGSVNIVFKEQLSSSLRKEHSSTFAFLEHGQLCWECHIVDGKIAKTSIFFSSSSKDLIRSKFDRLKDDSDGEGMVTLVDQRFLEAAYHSHDWTNEDIEKLDIKKWRPPGTNSKGNGNTISDRFG